MGIRQYDSQVNGPTPCAPPALGGINPRAWDRQALAFTSDVTPRYGLCHPFEGANRPWRKLTELCAVVGKPLATTDNAEFGPNPEAADHGAVRGAIKASGGFEALDSADRVGQIQPVTTKTDGQGHPAHTHELRRGSIAHVDQAITDEAVTVMCSCFRRHCGAIWGNRPLWPMGGWGCSSREEGDAPPVDLEKPSWSQR